MRSAKDAQTEGMPPITLPYLLVMPVPVYLDAQGQRWLDALWLKDLRLHLDYLHAFTLACPCVPRDPPPGAERVNDPRIRFVDLPDHGRQSSRFFETARLLWQAVGEATLVHHSIGDWWPLSMNYLAALFAAWRGKVSVVVVESSGWRLMPGQPAGLGARLKAWLAETWGRWHVNRASLAVFTQAQYLRSLRTRRQDNGHVIHASWIDEDHLLSETDIRIDWSHKGLGLQTPLRVLFAGRLTSAKGVDVLLDAFRATHLGGAGLALDIIGSGERLPLCQATSRLAHEGGQLRVLDSVPYGPAFFSLLRRYHAVVVPSLSDEQPRIVYDAYAQGVPVLVSDTPGLLDCVQDGITGRTFARGDAAALAGLFVWAHTHRDALQRMGETGWQRARGLTHHQMHARRHRLLLDTLTRRGLVGGPGANPGKDSRKS